MAEIPLGMALDSLEKIAHQMHGFERMIKEFPQVKHSFVFLGIEGEILGRIENEDGIVTFYPNGAYFGHGVENWG